MKLRLITLSILCMTFIINKATAKTDIAGQEAIRQALAHKRQADVLLETTEIIVEDATNRYEHAIESVNKGKKVKNIENTEKRLERAKKNRENAKSVVSNRRVELNVAITLNCPNNRDYLKAAIKGKSNSAFEYQLKRCYSYK